MFDKLLNSNLIFPFLFIGFILPSFPIFSWMNRRFFEQDSYYSHGWMIPVAIILLLWLRAGPDLKIANHPSWAGLAIFMGGILIYIAARILGVFMPAAWGIIIAGGGIFYSIWGWEKIKTKLAPFSLLFFMIPLPGIWILALTSWLKQLSAHLGIMLAGVLGIQARLVEAEILIPGSPPGPNLTIGAPCSGLRSLIVFGALGIFVSLLTSPKPRKKITIFLAAVVLAPLGNLLRVLALIIFRKLFGPSWVEGFPHIIIGVIIYLFCLLVYFQAVRWILRTKSC